MIAAHPVYPRGVAAGGYGGGVVRERERIIQSVDRTFTHIAHLLRQEFGSKLAVEEKVRVIMHRTKTPLETYAQYASELRKIGSGSAITDQVYITAFEGGIDAATSSLLAVCQPRTLNDAVAAAMRVSHGDGAEAMRPGRQSRVLATRTVREDASDVSSSDELTPSKRKKLRTEQRSHDSKETSGSPRRPPISAEEKVARTARVRCYGIRELGHYASQCPKKKGDARSRGAAPARRQGQGESGASDGGVIRADAKDKEPKKEPGNGKPA